VREGFPTGKRPVFLFLRPQEFAKTLRWWRHGSRASTRRSNDEKA
jgi:hypothetical protein